MINSQNNRCDCGAKVGDKHLPACCWSGTVTGTEFYPSGTTFYPDGRVVLPEEEDEPITQPSNPMQDGKTYRAVSPNGDEILGTYEMCPARAEIAHFYKGEGPRDPVMWEHEGSSEMFWDAMETQTKDGKVVFLCSNGDEWTEDDLRFIEVDEHGNDVEPAP